MVARSGHKGMAQEKSLGIGIGLYLPEMAVMRIHVNKRYIGHTKNS
jgi:hypothetical protein